MVVSCRHSLGSELHTFAVSFRPDRPTARACCVRSLLLPAPTAEAAENISISTVEFQSRFPLVNGGTVAGMVCTLE